MIWLIHCRGILPDVVSWWSIDPSQAGTLRRPHYLRHNRLSFINNRLFIISESWSWRCSTLENVSLRWREKFEKHNKLFSFSHRLWWMQEKAIFWLVRILALRQAQPITEERTFCGCPGQRHLCTSEGRSSENWRNIKKDQRDVLPLMLLRRKLPVDRFSNQP